MQPGPSMEAGPCDDSSPWRRPPPPCSSPRPRSRLRRAHRPQRGRQPAPDHDLRRLPRRRRALRHRVRVRRRRGRVRLAHAAPGVPTQVERGGDWTLQRLDPRDRAAARGVFAARSGAAAARPRPRSCSRSASTRSTSRSCAAAATRSGRGPPSTASACRPTRPRCSTSTPSRSPIFLAAAFDADAAAARGQAVGDGTPVHLTIPTDNPWVPLRILALGKSAAETRRGRRLPADRRAPGAAAGAGRVGDDGLDPRPQRAGHRRRCSTDLRSDAGMEWVPIGAWLTKVRIDGSAAELAFDLAIDAEAPAPRRGSTPASRRSGPRRRRGASPAHAGVSGPRGESAACWPSGRRVS